MLATAPPSPAEDRHALIAQARRALLDEGALAARTAVEPWIARSWQRCLDQGLKPAQRVAFDVVSAPAQRRSREHNHQLLTAARPVLHQLTRAIAGMRYFAILTNALGIVVDVQGACDRNDPRASVIGRVGIDLSEAAVGTTAIGAALAELQPVWLHRGEHFFDDNSSYSCAGAPLFGPDGQCIGMLDLTGVDVPERPELRHLVARSARAMEDALLLQLPHALLLRVNWPGSTLGGEADGLLVLDADGYVLGCNSLARQLLPLP
ncbi:MAG: histidine kinase, partial [Comamonadaceae bacterium]